MRQPIREVQTQAFTQAMGQELQRRLDVVGAYPADAMGNISRREIVLSLAVALGLPCMVWFLLT